MVRIHPDPPGTADRESIEASRVNQGARSGHVRQYMRDQATTSDEANGAVAQLGERLLCKQEVVGSIPSSSTRPALSSIQAGWQSCCRLRV